MTWLLLGLAIRLAFLPFALHPDLLSVWDRIRLWEAGEFQLADFSFQALAHLLHRVWAEVAFVPLPDFSGVAWPAPSEAQVFEVAGKLLESPGTMSAVAAMKLPYALLDVAVGLAVSRLVPTRFAAHATLVWMLNPIAIYASSVFGKYEALMLLPLALGLARIQRGRLEQGFLLVGVAGALRLYPLLLVPPMVLAAAGGARRRLELMACALAPLAWQLGACAVGRALPAAPWLGWLALPLAFVGLWKLARAAAGRAFEPWLVGGALALALAAVPAVVESLDNARYPAADLLHHASFLGLGAAGPAATSGASAPLFALAYAAVLLWSARRAGARGAGTAAVLDAALLGGAAFYGTSFFHPQYAALFTLLVLPYLWSLPDARRALGLFGIGVLLLLLAFPAGDTTARLFLPLAPRTLIHAPDPALMLPTWLADLGLAQLGQAGVAIACAWLAWNLVVLRLPGFFGADAARPRRRSAALVLTGCAWLAAPISYFAALAAADVPISRPAAGAAALEATAGGALELATAGGVPSALRMLPAGAVPEKARTTVVVEERIGGAWAVVASETFASNEALAPGPYGTLDLSLERFGLAPGREYRIAMRPEAPKPRGSIARYVPIEVTSARALAVESLQELRARLYALFLAPARAVHAADAAAPPGGATEALKLSRWGAWAWAAALACALASSAWLATRRTERGAIAAALVDAPPGA